MSDPLFEFLVNKPPEKEGYWLLFCANDFWHYMENGLDGLTDCYHASMWNPNGNAPIDFDRPYDYYFELKIDEENTDE